MRAGYEYDANGNVRRTTVEKGGVEEITGYAYDEMNRIKQATQGEGGSGALPVYYKYNLSGQVTGEHTRRRTRIAWRRRAKGCRSCGMGTTVTEG